MILMKTSRLVYLFGILLILFIPLLTYLPGISVIGGDEYMDDFISVIIPFFILIEMLLYLFVGLLSGGSASLLHLIQHCFMLFLFRLLCCFFSGMLFSDYNETHSLNSLLYFWMGNPVSALLQVVVLMALGPHLAWLANPRSVSDKALGFVGERRGVMEMERFRGSAPNLSPVGGFIRVYSFGELGRLFLNVMGMEGYILYTHEGLVLSKECQLRFDVDRMVAVSLTQWSDLSGSLRKVGFHDPERMISQTIEHNFIYVCFNQAFYGIFIFKRGANMDESLSRLEPLARSARELLEMKYSPLI